MTKARENIRKQVHAGKARRRGNKANMDGNKEPVANTVWRQGKRVHGGKSGSDGEGNDNTCMTNQAMGVRGLLFTTT